MNKKEYQKYLNKREKSLKETFMDLSLRIEYDLRQLVSICSELGAIDEERKKKKK